MSDQDGATGAQSGTGTDGTQSGTGSGDSGTSATGAQSGAAGQGQAGQAATGNTGAQETVTRAEFETLRSQLSAADKRRTEVETELRNLKDKDLPELERFKRDVTELTKRAEAAEAGLRQERLNNAFLKDNTHTWHDPETALRLADLTTVTIDDAGKVTGLKEALKRLADAHPFLVKPKSEGDDDKGGSGTSSFTPPMNNGRQDAGANASKAAQQRRFPALRGRTGG